MGRPLKRTPPPFTYRGATSWGQPFDLSDVLEHMPVITATGMYRTDGVGLLQPHCVNAMVGTSWAGKTMVALAACKEMMERGHHVGYLDFESSPRVLTGRLLDMGAGREMIRERFHYFRPEDHLLTHRENDTAALAAQTDLGAVFALCYFVVIDAKAEALVMEGAALNDAEPVVAYLRLVGDLAEETHTCALLLDHPPGDGKGKKDGHGSMFNRNSIRGVILHLECDLPAKKGVIGKDRLYVGKDREAIVIEHGLPTDDNRFFIGDVSIDCTGNPAISVTIEPPSAQPTPLAVERGVVGRVLDAITQACERGDPYTGYDGIREALGARRQEVLDALKYLQAAKYIHKDNGAYEPTHQPPPEEHLDYEGIGDDGELLVVAVNGDSDSGPQAVPAAGTAAPSGTAGVRSKRILRAVPKDGDRNQK